MDLTTTFQQLGVSLGLGLLVGLQRERSESRLGGFRTFPLVSLYGTLCAQLAASFGGWIVAGGLLSLAAIIVVGNLAKIRSGETDPGLTTEAAMLLLFCVGAYLTIGATAVAVAVGAGIAVLLHLKPQLHSLASRIGDTDFKAIMQFVLIALVILPVLPNRTYDRYQVLNPHRFGLMVTLIVGISLTGYVIYKLFGQRVGGLIAGILGGLISSTATTVSYSRRARESLSAASLSALVVAIASTVVFFRVLVIVGIALPQEVLQIGPPLFVMFVVLGVCAGRMLFVRRSEPAEMPQQGNPTELKPALIFAVLFVVVLFGVAVAKELFGDRGLYVVSILSGLTDMDAITLSVLQLVEKGTVPSQTGWRVIMAGALSNLVFKGAVVYLLGGRKLFKQLWLFLALALVAGLLTIRFWPS